MFTIKKSAVAMALASTSLLTQQALAAGFALNDHSATASGNALAGAAASTRDISFSYWNPALLTNAKGMELYVSGAIIMPDMDITVNSASDVAGNDLNSTAGKPGKVVDTALVPAIYFAMPLNDKTVIGAALNAPFALSGDYEDDWAGRYHSAQTEIQDITLSGSIAHQFSDWFSAGASLQVHSVSVTLDSAITDLTGGLTINGDGYGNLEADDVAVAYALGMQFTPSENTRLGVGYRSDIDILAEGKASYRDVSPALALSSGIDNADIQAENTLPGQLILSAEQDINDKFTVGATAMMTFWSTLDELRIVFDPGADNNPQGDSVLTFGFDDEWFYSLGLTYKHSDKLSFRTGIAVDQSPVTDQYRSARTPDGDRQWLSFGGTYTISDNAAFIISYTYVDIDDVTVDRNTVDLPEDAVRGNLNADYETNAHVLSLAYNVNF
jgi:long-chain fatty acid transport protein